jgi:DUF4097 and DUF4098 domain-containing protein YvlB
MKTAKWILTFALLPMLSASTASLPRRAHPTAPTVVAVADDDDNDMPVREEATIQNTFTLTAAADRSLSVDNVFGSIDVVGSTGSEVKFVVKETIRAETKADLEKAKQEVKLDATHGENYARFYVDGPFRCHRSPDEDDGCCCGNRWDDRGYRVKFDFQLQVPNQIAVKLKTVNEGVIKVQGISGDFSIQNVNGRIDVLDAAGSGKVKTVNGGVKVTFRANPTRTSEFSTINGPVELYFTPGLSADFRFKTFNGEIYTDYEVSTLPAKVPESERHGGKFVFRSDRYTGLRVGSGGPEIKVENLNGDIRVLQRHAAL